MGAAAEMMVTGTVEKAIIRQRPTKPLKSATRASANVIAFQRRVDSTTPSATAVSAIELKLPTTVPFRPCALSDGTSTDENSILLTSASNDSVLPGTTSVAFFTRRNTLAAAVLSVMTIGAAVSTNWSSNPLNEQVFAANSTQSLPTPVSQQQELSSQPLVSQMDLAGQELETTHESANPYLDEIERLQAQNGFLNTEIASLGSETTSLNFELLQLELAIAARESQALAQVETHTVYNFINVPVGGYDQQNDNSAQDWDYSYAGAGNQFLDEEGLLDDESVEFDDRGQPIGFVDYFSG